MIPLQIAEFEAYYFENDGDFDFLETELFDVRKPGFIAKMSDANNTEQKIAEEEAKEIKNDSYIIESFLIMQDLLKMIEKTK